MARSPPMDAAPITPFPPSRRNPPPRLYGVVGCLNRLGLGRLRGDLSRGLHRDVLELGVGSGRNCPTSRPGRSTGVDPDALALRLAARRSPATRPLVAEAEALPFDDDSFDWVVSALVVCTVRQPTRGTERDESCSATRWEFAGA